MLFNRRTFLAAAPAMMASAVSAEEPPLAFRDYERVSGGRIGVYAENLVTGAKLAWRADERFVMCSTFKASLAACVLARVDRGEERLDRMIAYGPQDLLDYAPVAKQHLANGALSVADMCAAVVELSDNTCANLLLAQIGGPAALTAFWRTGGDTISRLDHNEPVLNQSPPGDPRDTTTPAAMAGNLRRFVLGETLSAASRARLIGWMVDCQTGSNRLRAGLPSSWRTGDKTGNNGRDACGDVAVTWAAAERPILICAYTQGGTPTARQFTTAFTPIGQVVGIQLA